MVSLAVDGMVLPDFIHYIFSDIFAVNYVMDTQVRGSKKPITLNLKNKLSEYQLFELIENVLQQQGLSIFLKDDVYYIWQQKKHKQIALGIGNSICDIPAMTGRVQQIIPLKYADAMNLLEFLPRDSGPTFMPAIRENIIVVTGTRDQVVQALEIIESLDRPAMRGRNIGMMQLTYWSPADMVKKLTEILTEEGIPVTDSAGRKGVYIAQIERWGTIIFFAAQKEWLERVKYWVKMLDVPSGKKKRYFIYIPQNCDAGELGESLQTILGIAGSGGGISGRQERTAEERNKALRRKKEKNPAGQKDVEQIVAVGEDVSMAVDEGRNALILYTTPERFKAIHTLLEQLDVMPVQVLLNATVAEVTLTGSLQYGLEWYLKNGSGTQNSILKTLSGLGLGSGGMDYSLITDSQKFQLLINALARKDMVKVLSSPRIMVRDGKNASIVVGTEVPVITSEATSPDVQTEGTSGIIRSVQYRSTGVSLSVTPSVHARGVVTLEISQEVSEAQANNTSNINSPIILNRTLSTEVVAADGQTILLGGLIKENKSNTVAKVPLLGDIPFIGYFFKTTSKGSNRTELVVMITPHIIRNTQQIDEMRDALFRGFRYIGTGDTDKHR